MRILRNKAFIREIGFSLGLTALLGAAGFWVHPAAGCFALGTGMLVTGVHAWMTAKRYREIAKLTEALDQILHGELPERIGAEGEGELSILTSDLWKVINRLSEQNEALTAERGRLSDALADILHQIRTPLTSLRLGLAMLADTERSKEEQIELSHELTQQANRIGRLVEMLLKLSRLDAGTANLKMRSTSVRELLNRAAGPFRIPMELQNQILLIRTEEETVVCDPDWTTEAIGNLIKNAAEHTPEGGTVTALSRETPLFVEIQIRDTGEGIPKEDLGRLFERYYKGRNAVADSIGIGLAFAREIIAAQNGTITASNAAEGGACFTIRFYKTVV